MVWTNEGHTRPSWLRWIAQGFARAELPKPVLPPPLQTALDMPSLIDGVEAFNVLMLGHRGGALDQPARWLADLGVWVRWLAPDLVTLAELADGLPLETGRRRRLPTHVLIDLEALDGIAMAMDGLRNLRDKRPGLAVILVSEEFQCNDFSLERLAICDASLRAPVTYASLEFAMTEAREVNNPMWIERLEELATLT